ncbi:flagellar basal-body rod protein FlgB [Sulfuricella denitrificans skB26]|uniref:Flagellar basal body rod protein FlgB n=1 Tax=Sulfuricella denitrificans (strain DSM 22764 / NBRC 105220 / skB26) TaxID=1163617 RepID=S6AAA6_SULDS|nr:flagellar basal body rod protein FlgB [Sulfuricella denitrificans]BAN35525.1 flagellar basal-body rod protein FlgB [Sulfuricella denitrificans skB26]
MISGIDKEIGFLRDALNLRANRQQMLASNIANADTPNYKARDINFATELQRAQGAQVGNLAMNVTSAGHMKTFAGTQNVQALYRAAVQPSIDGNTVDMDVERAQFTDNAIHYQFLLDSLGSKFKTMQAAIQGQ